VDPGRASHPRSVVGYPRSLLRRTLIAALVTLAGLATGGAAAAASAPTVTTGAVTAFGSSGAMVAGTVNPNGQPTSWWFEYGQDTKYGSKTPVQDAGSGTTGAGITAMIDGLDPKTTYHYRLVAANDTGTTLGADGKFTTAAAPPPDAVTGLAAVTGTSATLSGTVNPNGRPASWYFEYGTTTRYGRTMPSQDAGTGATATGVSATLSGMKAGDYHFRLVATSDAGTSRGHDATFTVGGVAPGATTSAASGVTATAATLRGTVDPNGQSTSWRFEYGTTTAYGSTLSATATVSGTKTAAVTAPLAGLAPGLTYHFRLVATSSAGTTSGADAAFTTLGGVTIDQPALLTTYGRGVTLSGSVTGGKGGVSVNVLAQEFGDSSVRTVATVKTDGDGRWVYAAWPTIRTSYEAGANGATSRGVMVAVRPAVSLSPQSGGLLVVRVRAETSFARRGVQLQRRAGTRWTTVGFARLDAHGSTTFRASALPRGTSTVRVAMSVNQAGPGYLAGFSPALVYTRG
jgi:hypothetical protein